MLGNNCQNWTIAQRSVCVYWCLKPVKISIPQCKIKNIFKWASNLHNSWQNAYVKEKCLIHKLSKSISKCQCTNTILYVSLNKWYFSTKLVFCHIWYHLKRKCSVRIWSIHSCGWFKYLQIEIWPCQCYCKFPSFYYVQWNFQIHE